MKRTISFNTSDTSAIKVKATFERYQASRGNHSPTDMRRQTPFQCLNQNSRKVKTSSELSSGGSVSSGPLPLINHSNYLPQPQECAGRAAPWPLPRWELWGLSGNTNTGWVHADIKGTHLYKDARNDLNRFLSADLPAPPPFTTPAPFVWVRFWNVLKLGHPNTLLRCNIYLTRTVVEKPNLYPLQCKPGLLSCYALH